MHLEVQYRSSVTVNAATREASVELAALQHSFSRVLGIIRVTRDRVFSRRAPRAQSSNFTDSRVVAQRRAQPTQRIRTDNVTILLEHGATRVFSAVLIEIHETVVRYCIAFWDTGATTCRQSRIRHKNRQTSNLAIAVDMAVPTTHSTVPLTDVLTLSQASRTGYRFNNPILIARPKGPNPKPARTQASHQQLRVDSTSAIAKAKQTCASCAEHALNTKPQQNSHQNPIYL